MGGGERQDLRQPTCNGVTVNASLGVLRNSRHIRDRLPRNCVHTVLLSLKTHHVEPDQPSHSNFYSTL